jgi:uncharacterized phage protein gp47/JayE
MSLTVQQLLTPTSESQAFDEAIAILQSLGFNATSWQPGTRPRTIVQLIARLQASLSLTIVQIVEGGFLATASGPFLDLLGESHYQLERVEAVATEGAMRLTSSATAPPHTIAAGQLQIATTATQELATATYRSLTGGTLNPGSTLDIDVAAEVAGAAGNISSSQPLYMWTPLVGVTVANPADPTSGTWITEVGIDEESDERYRDRCASRWSTLSYAATEGAYRNWALEASSSVTRVRVRDDNPYGPGTVEVILATSVGSVSDGVRQTVEDYINGTDGVGRRPLNDVLTVSKALVTAIGPVGTIYVLTGNQSETNDSSVAAALDAYLGALPIGGVIIPPASTGSVPRSQLIALLQNLTGVLSVNLSVPALDIELGINEVVTGIYSNLSVVYV